jgi:hypothetical protein
MRVDDRVNGIFFISPYGTPSTKKKGLLHLQLSPFVYDL